MNSSQRLLWPHVSMPKCKGSTSVQMSGSTPLIAERLQKTQENVSVGRRGDGSTKADFSDDRRACKLRWRAASAHNEQVSDPAVSRGEPFSETHGVAVVVLAGKLRICKPAESLTRRNIRGFQSLPPSKKNSMGVLSPRRVSEESPSMSTSKSLLLTPTGL